MAKTSAGSSLITQKMERTANMTDHNQLGNMLKIKPHKMAKTTDVMFAARNLYSNNPLTGSLMGSVSTEETIDAISWDWDIDGAEITPLVSMGNINLATTVKVGARGGVVKLWLDKNFYVSGDVISPGTAGQKHQCRIFSKRPAGGGGTIYEARLMTNDPNDFIPKALFAQGKRWCKLFSVYGEASTQGGSVQFADSMSLHNKMSLFRKAYKVTGLAANTALAIAVKDSKGNWTKSWMKYAEAKFWQQWYEEMEVAAWYGRSTDVVLDANGRPVMAGPGINEQLEDSHIAPYSHLTGDFIEQYLQDIFYGRTAPGTGKRKVMGYTGEYGAANLHKAMMALVKKGGFVQNIEKFIRQDNSTHHNNSLEFGYQFTKYSMTNGATLEVVINPLFDNKSLNMEIDEITGNPVASQKITFLDFTGGEEGSNIKMMNKKNGQSFGYVSGLQGPNGPNNGGQMAHTGSYYSMVLERIFGMHIHDITKCGELRFVRN